MCVLVYFILSGLLVLASFWHWIFWDLELFIFTSRFFVLDLFKIFGIHFLLASLLCFNYGVFHLSGLFGFGIWTSDSYGLIGSIRFIKPSFLFISFLGKSYGIISGHHIFIGFIGVIISLWHISSKPGPLLYKSVFMLNLETVLASSIASMFFITFITSALMWYGSTSTFLELMGPTRYLWDNGFINQEIDRRVNKLGVISLFILWEQIPDKLILYDYIGSNPSKGGLFRSGPILKGDGIISTYLGHLNFELGSLSLNVRRMPAFFETFPVLLIDQGGSLRADIPFRRAESRYSLEEKLVICFFINDIFSGYEFSSSFIIKNYARKAQFGEIFSFNKQICASDGVFRTSIRGWYSFSHLTLGFLFFFGHLWHAARTLFKYMWTGVSFKTSFINTRAEKLGDTFSFTSLFI